MSRYDKIADWIVTRTIVLGVVCTVAGITSATVPSLKTYQQGWVKSAATFFFITTAESALAVWCRPKLRNASINDCIEVAQSQQARSEELLREFNEELESRAESSAPPDTESIESVRTSWETWHQCLGCENYDCNPYLRCAVHPLGPDPLGCRDYTFNSKLKPRIWRFIQIRGAEGSRAGTYFYREQLAGYSWLDIDQMGWVSPSLHGERLRMKFGVKTLNQLIGKTFEASSLEPYEALNEFLNQ